MIDGTVVSMKRTGKWLKQRMTEELAAVIAVGIYWDGWRAGAKTFLKGHNPAIIPPGGEIEYDAGWKAAADMVMELRIGTRR